MDMLSIESMVKARLHEAGFKRLFIAYSGGMDSSALLYIVSSLKLQIPVFAIHVHHGLSIHADDWLLHCEQQCRKLGIELFSEKVKIAKSNSEQKPVAGVELAARQARYDVFSRHLKPDDGLLMAHHQDDQVETFMMRLMRGSGLTGLSVMDDQRKLGDGQLLRPLLEVSRKQIEEFAALHNIKYVEDDSNTNTEFDRNWWRHDLLPIMKNRFPQGAQSILKTIEVLKNEHKLLNDLLEPIYQNIKDPQGCLNIESLKEQPLRIQCQIIRKWLEELSFFPLLADKQINSVLQDVMHARQDAEPVFKWQQNEIRRHNGKLYCMNALPEINLDVFPVTYEGIALSQLPLGTLEQRMGLGLKPGRYQLSLYDGSAKARPVNRPNKNLKKWFQEYAIPPWQRPYWPVLIKDGVVVAVPGLFVCQGYACEQGWQLKFKL